MFPLYFYFVFLKQYPYLKHADNMSAIMSRILLESFIMHPLPVQMM